MPSRKPRILVVEDEPLIALYVKELLDDLNCECVGPIKDLPNAEHYASTGSFDAAILNLVIDGKNAYSVAEALAARGIPFAFASGVPHGEFEAQWRDRPHLAKPYGLEDVRLLVMKLLATGAGTRH
jgi:CheY-like chemotaxis protein